ERLGPDSIDAPLGFDARLHEAGVAQDTEVLGHRSLRHPQPALDLADGSLRQRQQAEDGPAVRLRDDRERGLHVTYMPTCSYSRQVTLGGTRPTKGYPPQSSTQRVPTRPSLRNERPRREHTATAVFRASEYRGIDR